MECSILSSWSLPSVDSFAIQKSILDEIKDHILINISLMIRCKILSVAAFNFDKVER